MASDSKNPKLDTGGGGGGGDDDVELGSKSSDSRSDRSRSSPPRENADESVREVLSFRREHDVETAPGWSDWEKLPSYDRLRTAVWKQHADQEEQSSEIVDVRTVDSKLNQDFVANIFRTSPTEDNDRFLARIRERMDKVDVHLPTVEVRFKNLTLNAKCEVGNRSLPTMYNTTIKLVDTICSLVNLSFTTKADLNILQDVSGILKPGRMTLLLGPPSCGKSSLLRALAGKLENKIKEQGEISYNGHTFKEFSPIRTSAYISQGDLHVAEFTVRETIDYSAQYQGVGSRFDLLKETVRREKEQSIHPDPEVDYYMKATAFQDVCHDVVTDYVLKILGLEGCADTLIGDEMIRGISGGQKKRVTIGEMIVGPARVHFMDEITSGLDSATASQIITCLGQFAHRLDMTLLVALLQPAPEVFNLFDDVILLGEGKVVFHGPREEVLPFFESCGFRCPRRKGVADFLQEVTSRKDQEQYWSDKSKQYQFVSVDSFNNSFRNSPMGVRLQDELATPFDKTKSHEAALVKQDWPLSQIDLFKISFQKEILFIKRNNFLFIFKTVQMMIQGLIIMSLFFRTENHRRDLRDAAKLKSALFAAMTTVMFTGYSDIVLTVVRLPFFYKQRDMKFIPGWAFSLSTFATRVPFSFTESIVFLAIIYYPIGFAPAGGRFLKQLILFIVAHQAAATFFRMLAGFCGTIIIANSVGSMGLLMVYILGGYVVTRARFKPWWLWGYWLDIFSWALTAINEVEFLSPQWNERLIEGDTKTLGQRELHIAGLYSHGYWYWASFGFLLVNIVIFNLLFAFGLTYRAPGRSRPVLTVKELEAKKNANAALENSAPAISSSIDPGLSRSPGSETEGTRSHSALEISRVYSEHSGPSRSSGDLALVPAERHGMILPFQPLSISFDNICYFVDMPASMRERGATEDKLQLLKGITGAFRPGILTALVGVTGAGKSTLMDVLLGRKTVGIVQGDIRISGFPKNQKTFNRVSGYCEQNDVHSPQLTIHESLTFSAWLRLNSVVKDETRKQFVEEVMALVELENLRNSLVGTPAQSGLSVEQRKRLTIAVELVANPSIIFMDEPTTGLDARGAAIVMRAVRNTVNTGRTVVCTIHQPSIEIFESFDELLLLKEGGQCIYAGPLGRNSNNLVKYLEAIPGVPKINNGYNPAAWMLDVTAPSMERKLGVDFASVYENSSQYERTKALVDELSTPPPGAEDLNFPHQFAKSTFQQLLCLVWKMSLTYWRTPEYNVARYSYTLFNAFFFGTLFLHIGQKRASQFGLQEVLASVYASALMIGIIMAITVQPVLAIERSVSYRERAAGMYSSIPFGLSQLLLEIPYTLVQAVLYSVITYALINLEWKADKFFLYVYYNFHTLLMFIYYGMMMVAVTPNAQLAAVCAAFFFNVWNLFAGFIIAKPQMPVWCSWYYWACPLAWHVYGTVVSQFGDLNDKFITVIGFTEKMSIPHFLKITYGFRHAWLGYTVGMIAVFPFLFGIAYIIAIKYLNYQQR